MADIISAASRHVNEGTRDLSLVKVRPQLKVNPQFVPLFALNTPKGDYRAHHVTGDELMALYGIDAILATSKYANHASIMAGTLLAASGNSVVVRRLPGKVLNADGTTYRLAKTAKKTFYMAYYEDGEEGIYDRDIAGRVKRDAAGAPIFLTLDDGTTPTIPIYRSAMVSKYVEDTRNLTSFTDTVDGKVVNFVPLFSPEAEAHGKHYNETGISITSQVGLETDIAMRDSANSLAYSLRVYDKSTGTKTVTETALGSKDISFSLQPYSAHPTTNQGNSLPDLFPEQYGNYIDRNLPLQPYGFSKLKMHDDIGVGIGLDLILTNENSALDNININPILPTLADFDNVDPTDTVAVEGMVDTYRYLTNFLTHRYTSDVEWESVRSIPTAMAALIKDAGYDMVVPDETIPTYLESGEDGIINDIDLYEDSVVEFFQQFADPDSPVNSIALNRDNVFLDSGFEFTRKLKLGTYISNRNDTFAAFGTYGFNINNTPLEVDEDLGKANILKSVIALNTESKAFGTPAMRAAILLGSGMLANGTYRYRMPMTLDWGVKAIRFYGSLSGSWIAEHDFSTQDGNIVTEIIDVYPKYIKPSIKDTLQRAGLIWIDNENEIDFFYPGQQTIYPYDNSILNSVKTVICACTIHRLHDKIHRLYSGADDLTDTQLKIATESDMETLLSKKFSGSIRTTPEVYYTERDKERGWVWRLKTTIENSVMKTVMFSSIDAKRLDNV